MPEDLVLEPVDLAALLHLVGRLTAENVVLRRRLAGALAPTPAPRGATSNATPQRRHVH